MSAEGVLPVSEATRSASFHICVNEECIDLVADTNRGAVGGRVEHFSASVRWTSGPPAPVARVDVTIFGRPDLRDGDRYSIDVTDPATGDVVDLVDRVVTYTVVEPNGEGCPPTCGYALLTW